MSYLQRQPLTLVLNRFKTNAEGWRSGERVQSLWQREGNFLSVLRTNQKRMEATLGPRIFPLDRNVKQLYAHCALNTSLILFIVPLSRFHSHVTGMCNSCKLIVLLIGASILFIALCHYRASIAPPLRLWRS